MCHQSVIFKDSVVEKKRVFVRADASGQIGFGHFVRSLALAEMLRNDFDCVFFTVNPSEYQRREVERVCRLYPLQPESHFADFLSCLRGDETVVLDNYFFTIEYQKAIKAKGCCLVCIDDLHDRHYVADAVINHGVADAALFSVEPYTRLCLGVSWALLRQPFLRALESGWHRDRLLKSALVCVGGSDPYNLVAKYLNAIRGSGMLFETIKVIAGLNTRIPEGMAEVEILPHGLSAQQICSVLQEADMGFFSASTICLEALSVGLPSVVGYYVDNQEGFYHYITGMGAVWGVGDLLASEELDMSGVSNFMPKFDKLDMYGIQSRYIELFEKLGSETD